MSLYRVTENVTAELIAGKVVTRAVLIWWLISQHMLYISTHKKKRIHLGNTITNGVLLSEKSIVTEGMMHLPPYCFQKVSIRQILVTSRKHWESVKILFSLVAYPLPLRKLINSSTSCKLIRNGPLFENISEVHWNINFLRHVSKCLNER